MHAQLEMLFVSGIVQVQRLLSDIELLSKPVPSPLSLNSLKFILLHKNIKDENASLKLFTKLSHIVMVYIYKLLFDVYEST